MTFLNLLCITHLFSSFFSHFYYFPVIFPMDFCCWWCTFFFSIACLLNVGSRDCFVRFLWVLLKKRTYCRFYTWLVHRSTIPGPVERELQWEDVSARVWWTCRVRSDLIGTLPLVRPHNTQTTPYPCSYCGSWTFPMLLGV